MPKLRVMITIITGFLMFSCGPPVRSCWAERKYNSIVGIGDWGSQSSETQNLQYFQVDSSSYQPFVLWRHFTSGVVSFSSVHESMWHCFTVCAVYWFTFAGLQLLRQVLELSTVKQTEGFIARRGFHLIASQLHQVRSCDKLIDVCYQLINTNKWVIWASE